MSFQFIQISCLKINNPYKEIKYLIKNNDSIEKILKKYKVQSIDIKNISTKLKEKFIKYLFRSRTYADY